MAEEKGRSFWKRIFGGEYGNERERKALEYIVYRLHEGAHLEDVVNEEYVLRTIPQHRIDEIRSDHRIVEAARQGMEEDFSSGKLDPHRRPE